MVQHAKTEHFCQVLPMEEIRDLVLKAKTIARAEHIAVVDKYLCEGCDLCAECCQFYAIDCFQEDGKTIGFEEMFRLQIISQGMHSRISFPSFKIIR